MPGGPASLVSDNEPACSGAAKRSAPPPPPTSESCLSRRTSADTEWRHVFLSPMGASVFAIHVELVYYHHFAVSGRGAIFECYIVNNLICHLHISEKGTFTLAPRLRKRATSSRFMGAQKSAVSLISLSLATTNDDDNNNNSPREKHQPNHSSCLSWPLLERDELAERAPKRQSNLDLVKLFHCRCHQ